MIVSEDVAKAGDHRPVLGLLLLQAVGDPWPPLLLPAAAPLPQRELAIAPPPRKREVQVSAHDGEPTAGVTVVQATGCAGAQMTKTRGEGRHVQQMWRASRQAAA